MGAGRKAQHAFNTLQVGESCEMKGKSKKFVHQYVYQYGKSGRKLRIIRDGSKVFVERVA